MWLTALILGFAGSMHCLGMCTPLVLAVTGMKQSGLYNRIIYNSGRILTYGLLGAGVATAGLIIPLHKYQNVLSIILGLILLVIGIGGIHHLRIPAITPLLQAMNTKLKKMFSNRLAQKTRGSMFVMGVLNGLLPCGLTLIALTWCITLRGPVDGLNFMVLFGVGTLPVMLGFAGILPTLVRRFQLNISKVTTSMLIISGFLLIVRVFLVHAPHAASGSIMDIMMCR